MVLDSVQARPKEAGMRGRLHLQAADTHRVRPPLDTNLPATESVLSGPRIVRVELKGGYIIRRRMRRSAVCRHLVQLADEAGKQEETFKQAAQMAQMLAGMDAQEVPVHEASWLLCASWNRGVLQLRQEQPASTRFVAAAKWLQLGLELVAMPCLTVEHARYKEAMTRTFQEVCQFTPCSPHTRNYLIRFLT
jgi:hypothetical protein